MKQRYQKSDLPNESIRCPMRECVYNERGWCDDPRINNGNGDAHCYKWTNKKLLIALGIIKV